MQNKAFANSHARIPETHLIAGLHSRGELPHLKKEGGTYFVTFRLRGALPAEILAEFKAERAAIVQKAIAARRPLTWREREEVFRWYSSRVDQYLDRGFGESFLTRNDVAEIVCGAMQFHKDIRFVLHAWVIMPNHVHALVRPLPDWTLSEVLKSWKGFTARKINLLLGRDGPLWQNEPYDHLIRDREDFDRCHHYTEQNPVAAKLCRDCKEWQWSSAFHVAQVSRPAGERGF